MIQRHESRALIDARAQLGRRRAADVRNEREVAVLTQARLVDAADLDSLRAQLDDAGTLRTRVGQVEQQSMTIERLYRQLAELRSQVQRYERGAASVPVQGGPPATEGPASDKTSQTDRTASDTGGGPEHGPVVPAQGKAAADADLAPGREAQETADADPPAVAGRALSDSVDITAFEAANRIANGVPRTRNGASRRHGSTSPGRDDLTLIEGVGPRIQSLCYAAGITTWQAMADTSVERLTEILTAAGPRYSGHQPQAWPDQAASLAAAEPSHAMAGEARAG